MEKKLDLPVWVLNLKQDTRRLQFMRRQLRGLNLPFTVIPAVDGSFLTPEEWGLYSKDRAVQYSKRELSPGEIATSLSHARMWERMLSEKRKEVLIFEDDVLIAGALVEILRNRNRFPKDWEFINFSTDAPAGTVRAVPHRHLPRLPAQGMGGSRQRLPDPARRRAQAAGACLSDRAHRRRTDLEDGHHRAGLVRDLPAGGDPERFGEQHLEEGGNPEAEFHQPQRHGICGDPEINFPILRSYAISIKRYPAEESVVLHRLPLVRGSDTPIGELRQAGRIQWIALLFTLPLLR